MFSIVEYKKGNKEPNNYGVYIQHSL